MTAWAPIEAPRLLADAARIMCPTMIDTDVPAPANRSDHPRMRGDRNNIIHKRLKSCGSSRAQLAVMATNVKAAMGITQ